MKKIIFYILLLIFSVVNVSALTNISDVNDSDIHSYENNTFIDNQYQLTQTDSLITFDIKNNCGNNLSCKQIFVFSDNNNNTLTFHIILTKGFDLFLLSWYDIDYIVSFNNKILDNRTIKNDVKSFLMGNIIFKGNSVDYYYKNYKLNSSFYFNKIIIQQEKSVLSGINIKYKDTSVAQIQEYIENSKNSLNIIFRLIYELIILIPNGFSWINIISKTSILNLQLYLLEPLTLLNTFIDMVIFVVIFISTKGLLWFIAICEMLMFIIAYGQNKNSYSQIPDTIITFARFNESFFGKIGHLLSWLYEKLLVVIAKLFRGGG